MPSVSGPWACVMSCERQWMWEALLSRLLPVCSQPPASPGKHPCPWCHPCACWLSTTLTFPASQLPLQTPRCLALDLPLKPGCRPPWSTSFSLFTTARLAPHGRYQDLPPTEGAAGPSGHGCGRLGVLGWLCVTRRILETRF